MTIREVLLGVTINLGNYENFRLDVTADSFDEAGTAIETVLLRMEKVSDSTQKRILSRYRSKILVPIVSKSDDQEPENHPVKEEKPPEVTKTVEEPHQKTVPEQPKGPAGTCQTCGAAITLERQKLSQTLADADLCMKCLNERVMKK